MSGIPLQKYNISNFKSLSYISLLKLLLHCVYSNFHPAKTDDNWFLVFC